ncbi:MAG: hypothetical protein AB1345_03440 [Chloroflexota bacterium]
MLKWYHRLITREALQERFSPRALRAVIRANLAQDRLGLQIHHPEYHFYDNAFPAGWAYVAAQQALIVPALETGHAGQAWEAFGRVVHSLQDFYSHSNYVSLWIEKYRHASLPAPHEIDPCDARIFNNPELCSGKVYYLLEVFSLIPGLNQMISPYLPPGSHARLNLDAPVRGPKFAFAFVAAVKRTRLEFEQLTATFPSEYLAAFTDRGGNSHLETIDEQARSQPWPEISAD